MDGGEVGKLPSNAALHSAYWRGEIMATVQSPTNTLARARPSWAGKTRRHRSMRSVTLR